LSRVLGGDKNASLFLLDNGIDGLKRSLENSKGVFRTDYVIFDENAITIENKEYLPNNYYADGGKVGVETILFAVRKGEPDWNEVLITNNPDKIEDAKKWALANGFDRLRVSKIDMMEKPDFKKTFADGGKVDKARYRIIDSNGRVKYTGGTEMGSWFTLEKAKQLVNYSEGEMIYEYNNNGDPLWEVLATGGSVGSKKEKSFESEGSTEGKGKLYEFFTPQVVADKMLALAQHYGFKGGNVLEPATGSGRLIKNLKDTNITAFEISKDNFEILKREFPNAELYNFNFEKAFLKEPRFNTLLNRKGTETWLKGAPFDLVLANPPYGKFSGLYSSYFKFKGQVEHFFILQTLYLLKKGGLGVYLIPSSFLRNGSAYNDIKKQIFEISEFVDAYRLPSNIFEKTQIGTDILILRKK
jgi:hypothetical protein